ncbi:MAG TPA: GNAT family N-acetyltransferase [Veillonellaceae bacterium]|jgi:ribosomal protein S18 acetylase RimI-like enzyme|nr:GNAT family N-acetyltransferase [Veillonellaceae bacterium]
MRKNDFCRITKACEEDIPALAAVEAACFTTQEAADADTFRRRIRTFPDSFLKAEKENLIVGLINGCCTSCSSIDDTMYSAFQCGHDPNGLYQAVFGLAVLPEYRHQGIASALMKSMKEEAVRAGRRGIILTCREFRISWYESLGFCSEGRSRSVHGGGVWYNMKMEWQSPSRNIGGSRLS